MNEINNEATAFEKIMQGTKPEFKVKDGVEQAFRQGYVEGVKSQAKEEIVSCITGAIQSIRATAERLIDRAEIETTYDAEKADRKIEELEEKYWSECRQISEYEAENRELKRLLGMAVKTMNNGSCTVSCKDCKNITPSGCPDYGSRFEWKYTEEALKLIGGADE